MKLIIKTIVLLVLNIYVKILCFIIFLIINKIYNSQILGCCGYVSIAQLLMYYDTILDDNIIDDSYVIKSNIDVNDSWTEAPGVLSNEELVFEY